MKPEVKTRLIWVTLYREIGNAGVACGRCGISRPTFRKWWNRFLSDGVSGLEERNRRDHPNRPTYALLKPGHPGTSTPGSFSSWAAYTGSDLNGFSRTSRYSESSFLISMRSLTGSYDRIGNIKQNGSLLKFRDQE